VIKGATVARGFAFMIEGATRITSRRSTSVSKGVSLGV